MAEQIELEGATIRYDLIEGDGPPLVLLPGWCCPRTQWAGVLDGLGAVRAAVVDLPGQGGSTTGGRTWSVADIGRAVADLVEHLGWDDVVLVGHSMGGAVAVEAANASPRVTRVVAVDALTYETLYPRQDEGVIVSTLAPLEADWDGAMRGLVSGLFVDQGSPLIVPIAEEMSATPQPEGLAGLRALMEWDRDVAVQACRVPIDVLATSEFLDPAAVERLDGRVAVRAAPMGGHFFLVDRPRETAGLIRTVLGR